MQVCFQATILQQNQAHMSDQYFKTVNRKANGNGRLASFADRAFTNAKETVVGLSWGPLVLVAKTTIVSLMERISIGQLRVLTTTDIYTFGNPKVGSDVPGAIDGELKAEIKVLNDAFWGERRSLAITVHADRPKFSANACFVRFGYGAVRLTLYLTLTCCKGFSEAYMAQDIEVDNLENVFKVTCNAEPVINQPDIVRNRCSF